MTSKYDTLKETIKKDYQTSSQSIRALSKQYGVPVSTIGTWSSKENWLRDTKLTQKIVQSKVKQAIEQKSEQALKLIIQQQPDIITEKTQQKVHDIVEHKTAHIEQIAQQTVDMRINSLSNLEEIQKRNTEEIANDYYEKTTSDGNVVQLKKSAQHRKTEAEIEKLIIETALKIENPDREKAKLEINNNTLNYAELTALGDEVMRFIKGEGEYA